MTSLNTTQPADTTDAGLRDHTRQYIALYKIYQNDDEFTDAIMSLISAHTNTLLERVEKEVIGEDEPDNNKQSTYDRANFGHKASDALPHLYMVRQATRNLLRAEQRTALATIKGEEK